MPDLKIALFQAKHDFRSEPEALADLDLAMAQAAASGAKLLVTPELFRSGYGDTQTVRGAAQNQDTLLHAASRLAAQHRVGLVLGYPEAISGSCFNSAAVFDRSGIKIGNYRKVALPNAFERECFVAGTGPDVFDFEGVRCSVLICYDIEFPELARRAAKLGAELLLVPTALRAKWRFVSDAIVPARAYENALFVAYCDYAADGDEPVFSGASTVCAPTGAHICSSTGPEEIIVATIDTAAIADRKSDFDFLRDLETYDVKTRRVARIT